MTKHRKLLRSLPVSEKNYIAQLILVVDVVLIRGISISHIFQLYVDYETPVY